MKNLKFPLNEPEQIFGNDAAEDEPVSVFESYALHRPEIASFADGKKPIQIARAYKGEGKSALLRLVEIKLRDKDKECVIVKSTGQALSPSVEGTESDAWVREWKRKILHRIACEIGASLSLAFNDDAISLVEEAERMGFKSRSFVSTVTDRLKSSKIPIEHTKPPVADAEQLLRRWLKHGSNVWVFIDDLDQNFRNEQAYRLKVATCFIAIRQIFGEIPEIRFRLAVRPNVWSIIKLEFEALSHVEQYMVDLPWSEGMFLDLVARRIEAYLKRTDQFTLVERSLSVSPSMRYEMLQALLFEDPIYWAGRKRPMFVALHTLSRHRPRWLIELCKVSAKKAYENGHSVILLDDITSQLEAFGQKRIEDMVAEFKSQCTQIEDLIFAFSGQNERYTTAELLGSIDKRILQAVRPTIVGMGPRATNRGVAQFLFQIGFLSARRDESDGSYEHLSFSDRPNLLRTDTNMDEGVSWEIHPVFRSTLKLKNVQSKSEAWHRGKR